MEDFEGVLDVLGFTPKIVVRHGEQHESEDEQSLDQFGIEALADVDDVPVVSAELEEGGYAFVGSEQIVMVSPDGDTIVLDEEALSALSGELDEVLEPDDKRLIDAFLKGTQSGRSKTLSIVKDKGKTFLVTRDAPDGRSSPLVLAVRSTSPVEVRIGTENILGVLKSVPIRTAVPKNLRHPLGYLFRARKREGIPASKDEMRYGLRISADDADLAQKVLAEFGLADVPADKDGDHYILIVDGELAERLAQHIPASETVMSAGLSGWDAAILGGKGSPKMSAFEKKRKKYKDKLPIKTGGARFKAESEEPRAILTIPVDLSGKLERVVNELSETDPDVVRQIDFVSGSESVAGHINLKLPVDLAEEIQRALLDARVVLTPSETSVENAHVTQSNR